MGSFPAWMIMIGGILAVIGAFWASHEQTVNEKLMRKSAEEMAANQIALRVKAEENAALTERIANLVTGGPSFCYLDATANYGTSLGPEMIVHSSGEFPIYDVGLSVLDLDELEANPNKGLTLYKNLTIGNLPSNVTFFTGSHLNLPDQKDLVRINAFLSARNGHFTTQLRFARVEGHWRKAVRSSHSLTSKILYEKIDTEFPRNSEGKIRWE